METQLSPIIDDARLNKLGERLFAVWPPYRDDRRAIEERWLKNLRQVRGVYDPEVLRMIPADKSKAYPKMTAWMVRGTIARLMQLLFPMTEKNYGIKESPLPDLPTAQLQEVLDGLVALGGEMNDTVIEKAILAHAKGKAERMEVKVSDDLQEMEFITLARKVVRSAVIYNVGILEGPLHRAVKSRTWQQDVNTGKWTATEVDKYKPLFEFTPVWSYYPDMTAQGIDKQDGWFIRRIMTRAEVEALGRRPDFLADRINDYLRKNTSGNYQALWWESEIKGEAKSAQASAQGKESRKFEILAYYGGVTGADLRAAGVTVPDADLGKTINGVVWMIDNVVIKAKLAPLGQNINSHHVFVFEDDDLSILGNGQCDVVRDTQLSLCETVRAMLDNASVIGPMCEINTEMLTPGQDMAISKNKTWFRESMGGQSDAIPAVRNVSIESHLPDLLQLANLFLGFGDKESGLPPAALGDTTGGGSEALRTSKNASMFLGAAALPIRDTVRNFDTFTISMISALCAWNTRYDPNPTRDGDYDVIARGSTSLIAKEVLAQALENFRAGITPDEAPHVKIRGLLAARAKVNDIPVDEILEDEDKANATIERNAQMQGAQVQGQMDLIAAQVKEVLTRALEHEAKASALGTEAGVTVLQTIIDAITKGNKSAADQAKNLVAAHAADTSRIVAEKPVPTGGGK
ncbi:MAG: hypothetical protein NUV51_11025 [Sulfuricaulis sp.]|nr:hypothetical protein [Sulfuricaulis sp.]